MHKLWGLGKGTELVRAAARGEASAFRIAVQRAGGQLDDTEPATKRTALHVAAASGFDVIVGELLDRRANSTLIDSEGNTPLHLAAAGGHARCVQLLLGPRNADALRQRHLLAAPNAAGHTPLFAAAAAGQAAAADALLRGGADANAHVLQGRVTVGHVAAAAGHTDVLAVLAQHGFRLSTDTLDMNTLLHAAAAAGHVATVCWLLQQPGGPDAAARNFDGKSALDLARAEGRHAVVQVLRSHAEQQQQQQQQQQARAAAPASSGGSGGRGADARAAPHAIPVHPEDERFQFYPSIH